MRVALKWKRNSDIDEVVTNYKVLGKKKIRMLCIRVNLLTRFVDNFVKL